MVGASCDDIYVIVLFSTFVGMAQGWSAHWQDFAAIPVSILLGILVGAVVGVGLAMFFETAYARRHYVRNSMKVIVVLGVAFLLVALENRLKGIVPVSGLLAVVAMACALKLKSTTFVLLCMLGTNLNRKERLFCVVAYMPKATVQAAIGSVPLALGLASGQIVLPVAVVAILFTAPLRALGIDVSCRRLLEKEEARKE